MNFAQVVELISDWRFLLLNVLTIVVVIMVAGTITYMFGFYFVEGALMAGIGFANMGGAGDIACLTACNRMYLLPFLTICTRIGGAINMVFLTFLAARFFGA